MSARRICGLVILLTLVAGLFFWLGSESDEEATALVDDNDELVGYEFPADSEDECFEGEYFDEESSVCVFECETEQECAELEQELEDELDGLYEDNDFYHDDHDHLSSDPSEDTEAVYEVSKGEVLTLASGEERPEHKALWRLVSAISPDELTDNYIDTFEVSNNNETDAAGYVVDVNEDGVFAIGFNLPDSDPADGAETMLLIVHELAHILTLNNDQIPPESSCNYDQPEPCLEASGDSDGLYENFVERFWSKEDIETSADAVNASEDGSPAESSLYVENPESYVSEYASSQPGEDIAESFAHYVVTNSYGGNSIADQKQGFFDDFEIAEDYKQQMRQGLKSQLALKRRAS